MPTLQEQHHILVRRESRRILKSLSLSYRDLEDLESYGYVGLLEAMKNFDPRKGVSFEYYAVQRVRGAIIEGIGSVSDFSRSAYKKLKYLSIMHGLSDVNEANTLSASHQTESSHSSTETPQTTTISHALISGFQQLQQMALMISLETFFADHDEKDETPEYKNEKQDQLHYQRSVVSDAFLQLSTDEKDLLIAVYDLRNKGDNASLYAQRTGINRSSVSRRHIRIIAKMKRWIQISSIQ